MSAHTHSHPRRARTLMSVLLATSVLAGVAWTSFDTPALAQYQPAQPNANTPMHGPPGFADLAAKVKGAVVNISTTEKRQQSRGGGAAPESPFPPGSPMAELFKRFFDQQQLEQAQPRHALGSGFIIDPSGYIVTNYHVVEGASKIMVTLDDSSIHTAEITGKDPKTDLALVKINTDRQLPSVEFGDSDKARVGDWIVAVGNPFGLGGTVTAGIVSAHGRDLGSGPYDDFMQFDAPINPGNSGGPVFDQAGRVVAVSSVIYSPTGGNVGIGFGVPSNLVQKVMKELREHGAVERGWLGVQMQPLTPPLAKAMGLSNTNGVVVNKTEPDSPAAKAGLQPGDVIVAHNGKPVKGGRDLALAVAETPAGQTGKLTLVRDGKEQTIDVTIGKTPQEQTAKAEPQEEEGAQIGLTLAPLTAKVREQLDLDKSAKGVVVAKVAPDSKAAESGLRPGDVITRVGNDPVNTPAEAQAKIKAAEKAKKEAVPLLVMREGTPYYVALSLAKT